MEHTITITFDQNDMPTGVFQVRLANADPSGDFGVWDLTSGEATVPWGTVVTEGPSETYSYTFTVENGHIYDVSWEITVDEGEDPVYRTYQVGPFFSVNNNDVRAVSTFSGNFTQSSFATLMLKVTDFAGNPVDAENIYIEIYDSLGVLVSLTQNIPERVDIGFYVYDWVIPEDQTEGDYRVIWRYVVDDIDKAEIQNIVISEKNADTATVWYSGRELEFRLALEHHLSCSQAIPIYYEQAKTSRDNQTYSFTFPDWNQSPGVNVYRNDVIVNSGVEVDYFRGSVTFDNPLLPQETVHADYNFRWFDDDKLIRFLLNAVQTVNIYPPHSDFTLRDVPDRYTPAVLYGAAKDALRQLMMCINFQEPAQVFGGPENAQKAFANFETLKQNYEKDWEKLCEQKKYGPYPRSLMIVTPEYTLPGGRCLHPDTELLVIVTNRLMKINNYINYTNVYTKEINGGNIYKNSTQMISGNDVITCTIKEIYKLFNNGFDIEVLSQSDLYGNLIFSPIEYIWESGIKTIYNLKTSNGYNVQASDEHLFYVNGKYIPLRDIKIGDKIVTCDNHSWEYSIVQSINQYKRKINMYDLEVFGTANLFANGIKCHNSRWFRYLFKG